MDPIPPAAVDVVVVGAGPAGCAAAAAARRQGATVELFHWAPAPRGGTEPTHRIGEGAAPGTSQLIVEIFGAATHAFTPEAHVPCPAIVAAWGGPWPVVTEHLRNPLGHAWNLDRPRFDADLRTGAQQLGVHLRAGHQVTSARAAPAGWVISSLVDGAVAPTSSGRFLIDATGRAAHLARRLGARTRHLDRLVALWSVWSVDPSDGNSSTYLEAVPQGWWYSVLLPGARRLVAHLTDGDLLPPGPQGRIQLARSARGLALIGPTLALSGAPRIVHGPKLQAARTGWLDRVGTTSWLAAGDAAGTADPLSGRGIIAALLSGDAAGRAAVALLAGGDSPSALVRYRQLQARMLTNALAEHGDAYQLERRWPGQEFWRRRHAAGQQAADRRAAGGPPR